MKTNETMMQFFEWYLPSDGTLWKTAVNEAPYLAKTGITQVWFPPAYKGNGGKDDVGYGVYDLYDLGEFDQKGSIATKYGTKVEYLVAINAMHNYGIKVLADVVFNQKMGADETEDVIAIEDNPQNRSESLGEPKEITAWTKFTFPGRILLLNGTGLIFMEQIGTKKQKGTLFIDFMANIGMNWLIKKMEISTI